MQYLPCKRPLSLFYRCNQVLTSKCLVQRCYEISEQTKCKNCGKELTTKCLLANCTKWPWSDFDLKTNSSGVCKRNALCKSAEREPCVQRRKLDFDDDKWFFFFCEHKAQRHWNDYVDKFIRKKDDFPQENFLEPGRWIASLPSYVDDDD